MMVNREAGETEKRLLSRWRTQEFACKMERKAPKDYRVIVGIWINCSDKIAFT